MKNLAIFITFALIFLTGEIYSQDLITLKSGEEIESKVMEVMENEIKYKKYSNIEGPTYSIKKSEVFMIKYQNGEKDVFANNNSANQETKIDNDKFLKIDFKTFGTKYYEGSQKISKKEFVNKIESNPVAYNQYNLGKNLNTAGNIIGIPAGIVFGYNIGTWLGGGEKPDGTVLTVSGLCWGGAIALNYIGRAKIRSSIDTYNTSEKFGYKLNLNQNGIGIAFQLK